MNFATLTVPTELFEKALEVINGIGFRFNLKSKSDLEYSIIVFNDITNAQLEFLERTIWILKCPIRNKHPYEFGKYYSTKGLYDLLVDIRNDCLFTIHPSCSFEVLSKSNSYNYYGNYDFICNPKIPIKFSIVPTL
jgi:hypothetical protein